MTPGLRFLRKEPLLLFLVFISTTNGHPSSSDLHDHTSSFTGSQQLGTVNSVFAEGHSFPKPQDRSATTKLEPYKPQEKFGRPPDQSKHDRRPSHLNVHPASFKPDLHPSGSSDLGFGYSGFPVHGIHDSNDISVEHFGNPQFHHHDHYEGDFSLKEEEGHHDVTSKDVAFAFLSYLILMAVLQGGLITLSAPPTAGRKRRDLRKLDIIEHVPDKEEKTDSWLLNDERTMRCMQYHLCNVNNRLVRQLGEKGTKTGLYISNLVSTSVDPSWSRLVRDAGKAGRSGVDCGILYRSCHQQNLADAPVP